VNTVVIIYHSVDYNKTNLISIIYLKLYHKVRTCLLMLIDRTVQKNSLCQHSESEAKMLQYETKIDLRLRDTEANNFSVLETDIAVKG